MNNKWVLPNEPNTSDVDKLSQELNINHYLAQILVQRNITSYEGAKAYFRPNLDMLNDPFEMKGMDVAVNRLTEAVFNNEKILLYGDYDVDGTTSVSLLYLFLTKLTPNVEFYIPDRYSEGYGLSEKGIHYAIKNKFALIITLDCGIRAVDKIAIATENKIDVIVCDHHIPGPVIPKALAILDPKQNDCQYPFKELSGCGVGFKLLEGFCQQNTIDKSTLFNLLDLVAISIASDIVPIINENRVLAYFGLQKLNSEPSQGVASLIEISGKKAPLTITDVVFSLGPRINAAGRLAHANESVNLLIGKSEDVHTLASALNDRNQVRRNLDQQMTKEALALAKESTHKYSTVLFKNDWHKGVVGIVASRCIETHYRPTIILTESNGMATGSARSVEGFDIYNALFQCQDYLVQFGGHTHAAGLTLELDNLTRFQKAFEEFVSSTIEPDVLIPKVYIDAFIPFENLTFKLANILHQMEPFGPSNMNPVFGTKNVHLKQQPKILKDKHIKGYLFDSENGKEKEFIAFNMADKFKNISLGQFFNVAYHLEINNYMGNNSLILHLKDVVID